MPSFIGPTVDVPFRLEGGLVGSLPHGLSVWRLDGSWDSGLTASAAVVAAADRFYQGGHTHPLTVDQADELTAAGFGAYILEDS